MDSYTSSVAGCEYYPDAFMSVCQKNIRFYSPDIQRREYELLIYDGPAQLVREPHNKHDKNAVMVVVNGNKIGYIPAADAVEISPLVKSRSVKSATVNMHGGNYKEPYYGPDGYGPEGRGFESSRARKQKTAKILYFQGFPSFSVFIKV